MRRADKEITSRDAIDRVLSENTVCHLSLVDKGRPYGLTMNYGYRDGMLYFHSADEGMKFDFLRPGATACFEIIALAETVVSDRACGYGTRYRSVKGYGKISFHETEDDKIRGLGIIMAQHTGTENWEIPGESLDNLVIFSVNIETVTGKESKMPPVDDR